MTFREVLAQVIEWLQQDKRVSYRALKMQFDLDDATLEALKEDLLYAHPVVDDAGRGLIWTGDPAPHAPDARRGPEAESRFHLLHLSFHHPSPDRYQPCRFQTPYKLH